MIRQFASILYPGSFFPEEQEVPVEDRDPQKMLAQLPPGSYGFRFYERQEVKAADGEVLTGHSRNRSPTFYIGQEFTTEEVVRQFPGKEHDILRFNLTANGYARAVLCRTGNWQPLNPGDVVLAPPGFETVGGAA